MPNLPRRIDLNFKAPSALQAIFLLVALLLCVSIGVSTSVAEELRIWTSSDGRFSAVAEFVRFDDKGSVVLRKTDGKMITVKLSLLSDDDKGFLQGAEGSSDLDWSESGEGSSMTRRKASAQTAAEVEREARSADTAEDAVLIYELNLSANRLSTAERKKVVDQMKQWRDMAKKEMVRLGRRWVSKKEAERARERASDKIDQAIEFLRLSNGSLAEMALRDASKSDPSSPEAELVMGLIHSLVDGNDAKAVRCFQECLRRDPGNVAILNNLAVSEFFSRRYSESFRHWSEAAELSPETKVISQNLASALSLASRRDINASKKSITKAGEIYTRLLKDYDHERPDKIKFYFIPPDRLKSSSSDSYTGSKGELISVGSGSGFVVAPGIILTNEHVIEDAEGLLIIDPNDSSKRLPAEVIAYSIADDLAIVRCSSLKAEPVKLSPIIPNRGSDIMVLGYPLGPQFGMNLKATRGSVVALPTNEPDSMCLYDALTNPGNSGGPLVDQFGRVVAVVKAITGDIGGVYGAAIPMERALDFLKLQGISVTIEQRGESLLDWPEVDSRIAPSTVLILNRQRSNRSGGLERKAD